MLGYKAEIRDMGDLKVAYPYGKVILGSEKKNDRKDPSKSIIYFPKITYQLALYKNPLNMTINAYFPMFILALLGLMIFMQENDVADRIANISVILLAYIAFIPTVRSIIPPVAYFTLADALIFFNFLGTGMLMLETVILYW